eukprot:CAMPEP_0204086512 /NCGR_PEP_ID=MMETSP0360-20130528/183181_1 /ASSEMBLY_ACC=CAM_ASM_000342 /TAXON_ID=268821 /ORGANISM="Scrippsiella Hangoei, Strain SHTV-5" /LENGTH=34 /DNA_ID= /DNA_START= /DNA_END= /DNA_ORIENTATION=
MASPLANLNVQEVAARCKRHVLGPLAAFAMMSLL